MHSIFPGTFSIVINSDLLPW